MLAYTRCKIVFPMLLAFGVLTLMAAWALDARAGDSEAGVAPEDKVIQALSIKPKSGRSPFCYVCSDNRHCCAGVEYCSRSADGRTVICVDAGEITLITDLDDGSTTVAEIDRPTLLGIMIAALCR